MQLNMKLWEDVQQEDRFYPESVQVFNFEPLRQFYQIIKSPEAINEGIISLISLNVDDIAFKWTGFMVFQQTLHSLQHRKGVYIQDPYFSGKILHSCSPNIKLDCETLTAYVIKPIRPLDKICCDYEDSEDILYNQFQCDCLSPNCKGWISGKIK